MKQTLLLIAISLSAITSYGQTQNALNLDGSNDYVTTSFAPASGNVARTIEAWIKTSANSVPTAGGRQQIITDFGSFTTGGRFTFNVLWGGAIRLEVGGNGVSGTTVVNDGNWHHVAIVYDPSNSAGTVSLYVDGNLDTRGTPTVNVNIGSTTNFTIGRRVDGVNNFTGEIDEVRYWNRALSQNDLNTGGGTELCPSSNGLLAYYQFNEATAGGSNAGETNLPDLISGNDGTLQGFSLSGTGSNWVAGAPITAIIDRSVSLTSGTLSSAQTTATSYQWIDCDTGTAISGETSASFTPTVTGNYAVEITNAGCTQLSECTAVTVLSSESFKLNGLALLKNPSNELLFNQSDLEGFTAIVTDLSGKILFTSNLDSTRNKTTDLASGMYLVNVITNENNSKVFKWIKE